MRMGCQHMVLCWPVLKLEGGEQRTCETRGSLRSLRRACATRVPWEMAWRRGHTVSVGRVRARHAGAAVVEAWL